MRTFLIIAGLLLPVLGNTFTQFELAEWSSFKSNFNKHYQNGAEEFSKMNTFMQNLQMIQEHNKKYEAGLSTYEMGVNKFTDMTPEEFRNTVLSRFNSRDLNTTDVPIFYSSNIKAPNTIDWRQKGAVTPVKNQADCGSCYAFGATGALESLTYIKTGKLIRFSEQNIVDCTRKYGNYACDGGWPQKSYEYVKANGGLATEQAYPYEGVERQCRYDSRKSGGTIRGYTKVNPTEQSLKEAVGTVGPVAVILDASGFQNYKGGILDYPQCNNGIYGQNHVVLAVGYGCQGGKDYWIVKNSWGTDFGQQGYILMSRNKNNQCGIALDPSFPNV